MNVQYDIGIRSILKGSNVNTTVPHFTVQTVRTVYITAIQNYYTRIRNMIRT